MSLLFLSGIAPGYLHTLYFKEMSFWGIRKLGEMFI